jgi:hypothetical protein
MKAKILATIAFALTISTNLTFAEQNATPGDCGAAPLMVENGKVSVTEDGKTTEIKAHSTKTNKAQMTAARTTCRSGGGYTVCSNGKHGCVWSDRSGKLLGCGAGI